MCILVVQMVCVEDKKMNISKNLLIFLLFSPSISLAENSKSNTMFKDKYTEISLGRAFSQFSGPSFLNPVGAGFTTSPTNGNYIVLSDTDGSDTSSHVKIAVGGTLRNNTSLSMALRSFNKVTANGYAIFGAPVEQRLSVSGSSVMVGVGKKFKQTSTFIEPKLEFGVARLETRGTQENGQGGVFPENKSTNAVVGLSVTGGYKLNSELDLIGSFGYHRYGNVKTGLSPAGLGMNAGERLESSLKVTSISVGLRFGF